jgi:hypothetical protein
MVLYKDYIIICGGHAQNPTDESRIGHIFEDMFCYNIRAKEWKKMANFSLEVTEHSVVTYNGYMWLLVSIQGQYHDKFVGGCNRSRRDCIGDSIAPL